MKELTINTQDPASICEAQKVLNKVILPWAPDSAHPPRFVRLNGLGRQVAIVSSWLGGFGDAHGGTNGWGYKSCPGGQGYATHGIEATKEEAMAQIDKFLTSKEFTFTILNDSEDLRCDEPNKAHKCLGTKSSYDFSLQ